jgi:hypothetical protein
MANEKQHSTAPVKKTNRKKQVTTDTDVPKSKVSPASAGTAATGMARSTVNTGNAAVDLDQIRRRAFELYEERGRLAGYEAEDWFRAEQELRNANKKSA